MNFTPFPDKGARNIYIAGRADPVGRIWDGVYHTTSTIFRKENAYVFRPEEWQQVKKENVRRIELSRDGKFIAYSDSFTPYPIYTPQGPRVAIEVGEFVEVID